ncbi:cytochrome P450 [Allokutzneria multivorans]|uniref:Cytochrome P450 n=1 Tax=Allokutzneria multivorans TaxID=1142134 RepID=A0ABP7SGF5_9PSEU
MTSSMVRYSFGRAPGAVPGLGQVLSLARGPLTFLASSRAHGDVVELRIGPKRAFLVCHRDVAWEVLRDPQVFDKGGFFYDKARQVFGDGLPTCVWADHQRQRSLVQPGFHRSRLPAYIDVVREEIDALTASWRPGQLVEPKPLLDSLFARVTARFLFSADLGEPAVAEIQRSLPILLQGVFHRMLDPTGLWKTVPTRGNRRFTEARQRMRSAIDEVIGSYRASGADHGDVVSTLLAADLADAELHDQILALLTGGTETTASVVAWSLYLLGTHPEAEARVHAEVDRLPGERLDYLRRVVTEALRLYPPGWILTRTTSTDTSLGGHPVRAGSTIVLSPYVLHRDPAVFAEPDRFDPDRWLPDRSTGEHRKAFLPFGAAARKCVADVLSVTEAVAALAAITANWRLRPAPGSRPRVVTGTALSPGGLSMITARRT